MVSEHREMERALRFACLTWYSFGAKGEHFAQGSVREPGRKPLTRVRELLAATAARLALLHQVVSMEVK